jgi:DNA (cytosine-5)-methyltransferase 1
VQKTNPLYVAGFFAGVGGIESGLKQAGFAISFANELDEYASKTYVANYKHTLRIGDIAEVQPDELGAYVDLIAGGFPCQAFSVAGHRKGFEDPRGNVFWELHRLIKSRMPQIIFLENVKNLVGHDGGNTFKVITDSLATLGYSLKYKVLNAKDYGNIPQNRERIYIVGFLNHEVAERFTFPNPQPLTATLANFIDFETKVDAKYYYGPEKPMFSELSKHVLSQDTVYQWRRHYVRENKSGVCPTLTANMGTGGHNVPIVATKFGFRKLTPRECFNLMGFPSDLVLPAGMSDARLYKQAGNAVVVPVIRAIGAQILEAINSFEE